MPLYFFDMTDEDLHRDDIGTECADDEQAERFAMQGLPDIARDIIPRRGNNRQTFKLLVRNEDGRSVYAAQLSFEGQRLK